MCHFFHDAIDSDGVIATFSSTIFLMLSWMEQSKEKLTFYYLVVGCPAVCLHGASLILVDRSMHLAWLHGRMVYA
jgi:hypothetical protein